MRECPFDELVGFHQLAPTGAQVGDLTLQLLAPLVEIGEHTFAETAGLADDLLGAVASCVFGLARLRFHRLLGRRTQFTRGLLRLPHHAPSVLLGLAAQLQRRLPGLAEHPSGLFAERRDEILV